MSQVAEKQADVIVVVPIALDVQQEQGVTDTGVDKDLGEVVSALGSAALASAADPQNLEAALMRASIWIAPEDPKKILHKSQHLQEGFEVLKGRISLAIDTASNAKIPDANSVKDEYARWSESYRLLNENEGKLDALAKERVKTLQKEFDEASRKKPVEKSADKTQEVAGDRLVDEEKEAALQRDRSQEIALLTATWKRIMQCDTAAAEKLKWLKEISDNNGTVPGVAYSYIGYPLKNFFWGSSSPSKTEEKAPVEKKEEESKVEEAATVEAPKTEEKEIAVTEGADAPPPAEVLKEGETVSV